MSCGYCSNIFTSFGIYSLLSECGQFVLKNLKFYKQKKGQNDSNNKIFSAKLGEVYKSGIKMLLQVNSVVL